MHALAKITLTDYALAAAPSIGVFVINMMFGVMSGGICQVPTS